MHGKKIRQLNVRLSVFQASFQLADSKGFCTKITAFFFHYKRLEEQDTERKIDTGTTAERS